MAVAGVAITGKSLVGENQDFVDQFLKAVQAVGGTQVKVISAYRSPAYNAQIGGASESLHMRGLAIDADVYIPGRGWVPAGTALSPVANRFNIRSGDQPGFFRGAPDPMHVDAGLAGGYGGGPITHEGTSITDIPGNIWGGVTGIGSDIAGGIENIVMRGMFILVGFALVGVGLVFIAKANGADVTQAIPMGRLAKLAG